MQCPQCQYEPTLAEAQENQGICPKCRSGLNQKDAWLGAKVSVEQLRSHEREERRMTSERPLPRGAKPVVVVSVDIPFMALVEFLIKLVLAALPAAAVLYLIYWLLASIFAG